MVAIVLPGRPALPSPLSTLPLKSQKRSYSEYSPTPMQQRAESPTKRARVTFKSEVEVRGLDEFEKPQSLVREEIRRAIQQKELGNEKPFTDLIAEVKTHGESFDESDASWWKSFLAGLQHNVVLLDNNSSQLVAAVLSSDCVSRSEDVLQVYRRLLSALVTVKSKWLANVLYSLVDNFVKTIGPELQITSVQLRQRTHKTLEAILALLPAAPAVLGNILARRYPSRWDSPRSHVLYSYNLLQVIRYVPELQTDILSTITERTVRLDMQIQNDVENLEGIEDGLTTESITFEQIIDSMVEDDDDAESDDGLTEDAKQLAEQEKDVRNNLRKIDFVIDLLFDYYQQYANHRTPTQKPLMDVLLQQFDTIILSAYRSRHTQFLIFHFAQQSTDSMDALVGYCLHNSMDKTRSNMTRQSATAYLASFVARGSNVPPQVVKDVFHFIGDELKQFRQKHERACQGPDLHHYGTYYSFVQALLYMFCFRWKDLEATVSDPGSPLSQGNTAAFTDAGSTFAPGIREIFSSNLFSKFNPLKVCSQAIATEFSKLAAQTGLIFVEHIMESNQRLRLVPTSAVSLDRESALTGQQEDSTFQLDEYFPFDPYHLPRSKRWLQGDYRDWEAFGGNDDNQQSESDLNYEREDEEVLDDSDIEPEED